MTQTEILEKVAELTDVADVTYKYAPLSRSYSGKTDSGHVEILANRNVVSRFTLVPLPGCCGVVVSTGAIVYSAFRGKGIGQLMLQYRINMAKEYGYSQIQCTVRQDNEVQNHLMVKNGFTLTSQFVNSRTGNTINTYSKNI